ncbi:hypothetical protein SK128_017618 [Halocaridina rubra]|uniref:DEP domain-containing protein n=1 Tax=Halocaridina rubra TaxID=373956 RepID=A0AAN9AGG0_HALRR
MSAKKAISGPYRATKLWNDAVRSFYNGMPVSRHWRGLRQYDRCFTASEAIEWLHNHLKSNPNFGSSVSREQTTKLLRKFLKAGLIEDVRGNATRPEDFRDNKELYKFSNKSPLKALRTPRTPGRTALSTIANNRNILDDGASPVLKNRWDDSTNNVPKARESALPRKGISRVIILPRKASQILGENAVNEARDLGGMQECHVVVKPLTKAETDNAWKQIFLNRLDEICNRLLFGDSSTLMNSSLISGEYLRHNMTQITSRGVVQPPEGHPDDLPNWILTAMKCMAHWPNAADASCNIPNYPGVETDVFKIVRDFFVNTAAPLITYHLYEPIIRLYIGAEFMDITCRSSNTNKSQDSGDGSYVNTNLGGGDSVENLILNMSMSSQQKTSTPNADDDRVLAPKDNEQVHLSSRAKGNSKLRETVGSDLHTPILQQTKDNHSISKLQSLKLRRLKNYTDFKDDSLYPSLLEGSSVITPQTVFVDKTENPRSFVQVNKYACELVARQPETVRSVKTNDQVRRLRRESKEAALEASGHISSDAIGSVSLPKNCCFETAFTSDSPKTRIIPQKSVDSIHLKNSDKSVKKSIRPRPVSIAVSSLVGLDDHSLGVNLWDTTKEDTLAMSATSECPRASVLSSDSSEKYVTAPIQSPLSRSRSAGNLQSLDDPSLVRMASLAAPEINDSPQKGFAGRLVDSIKRKNPRNTVIQRKRASHNKENFEGSVHHLRTKSGGYMNPALAVAPVYPDEKHPHGFVSDQEFDQGLGHFRTKSGGFLNLALAPSSNSLDHADSFDTGSSIPSPRSVASFANSQQSLQYPENRVSGSAPFITTGYARITTPDGCLSHSLSSSTSGCSSGRSLYYSVRSSASRSSTPVMPSHQVIEGKYPSATDFTSRQSVKLMGIVGPLESAYDVDLSKHLSLSANELSDRWMDRTPYGQVPPYARGGIWRHYHSSPSKRLIGRKKGTEIYFGSKACLPGLLTREGKEVAIISTQLLLLMLSPVVRRKLHLLLRMMSKMSANDKLNLDNQYSTRAIVLNTFTRSILLCDQEADYDEVLSLRIVSFMMDNHEEIMRPPQDLAVLVHRRLSQMQKSQIVYDSTVGDRGYTLTYCQQVSQAEYENQRMTGSQQFLTQLLDQIITNEKLNNKEKRKKLKEFRSLYPEVYKDRFPEDELQKTESRSSKIRNLMKFTSLTSLGRSRTLRL